MCRDLHMPSVWVHGVHTLGYIGCQPWDGMRDTEVAYWLVGWWGCLPASYPVESIREALGEVPEQDPHPAIESCTLVAMSSYLFLLPPGD